MVIKNENNDVSLIIIVYCEGHTQDYLISIKEKLVEKLSSYKVKVSGTYYKEKVGFSAFYRIVSLCMVTEFKNQFNNLIDILTNDYFSEFNKLGKNNRVREVEFFFNYHLLTNLLVNFEQLKLLKQVYSPFDKYTSISLGSLEKDNFQSGIDTISPNENSGHYYQLFFYVKEKNDIFLIVNKWNEIYYSKYKFYQYWGLEQEQTIEDTSYIVLIIDTCSSGILFEYNELENDLFAFIKINKKYLNNVLDKIVFGVYNLNYGGGEIGYTIINTLIKLNIDLLITQSAIIPNDIYPQLV